MPSVLDSPDQGPLCGATNGIHFCIRHSPTRLVEHEIEVSPSRARYEGSAQEGQAEGKTKNAIHAIRIGLMLLTLRRFRLFSLMLFAPGWALAQAPTVAGGSDEPPPPPPPNCSVAAFRTLALETPETRRTAAAMAWLKSTGKDCSLDRLVLIRNNRVQWLGVVDSASLAGEIDRLIEEKSTDVPSTVQSLYTSAAPAGGAAPAPK